MRLVCGVGAGEGRVMLRSGRVQRVCNAPGYVYRLYHQYDTASLRPILLQYEYKSRHHRGHIPHHQTAATDAGVRCFAPRGR